LTELPGSWALAELVEAAARAGDAHLAGSALERLEKTTRSYGNDFALGIEARSRALLRDGAAAEELYREALERLSRTQLRPEIARAHLVYGEWLRREGRRVDAREELRAAHEMLAAIGMEALAERARRELLATGEKARSEPTRRATSSPRRRSRSPGSSGTACPIVRSARSFSSARTRSNGIGATCTKHAIRSRKELRTALSPSDRLRGIVGASEHPTEVATA
jgi:tetratricopeptide (TPR) repeat protein